MDEKNKRRPAGATIMSGPRFARFVVRPDMKGAMVGFSVNIFEEGQVYEVQEFDGEFVIRKLGPSPLSLPLAPALAEFGFNNGLDWNRLYTERGGSLVRTIAEHRVPKDLTVVKTKIEATPRGTQLRMDFGDENAWCEHIEGNIYRSLSATLSNTALRLPPDHEHAGKNGMHVNMKWGHLFEGEVLSATSVRPLFIIGRDETPIPEGVLGYRTASTPTEPATVRATPRIDTEWKDEEGREFVVADYIMNSMDPWVCMTDGSEFRMTTAGFDRCTYIGPKKNG